MNRCSNPAHPHCTVWVMPGDGVCAHGHPQPAPTSGAPTLEADLPAPLAGSRSDSGSESALTPASAPILPAAPQRPHLHVSGFDPRAAGGRQLLRLELRGMPPDCARQFTLLASSRLRLDGGERHAFTRSARGEWLPVFLEFSSRGLEHGQYRIEVELHGRPDRGPARAWVATLLVLAPRADASLHDIHQTFLATHKNVRVSAEDASIARVQARLGGGSLDIDVDARNAGIAHLDLDGAGGKIDLGFSSIAWDEELFELDPPHAHPHGPAASRHPCPAATACLVSAAAHTATHGMHAVRHVRLFALDECVLGRDEPGALDADLLLAHHDASGPCREGLTRRISARHALIRRGREGFEIEDVSRYGLLLDGVWPGKHAPVPLRTGMRIELTASIPGVLVLEVTALLPHGLILHRIDGGRTHEAFYLVAPECAPPPATRMPVPGLPLLFHRDGGFWHADASGDAAPLTPTSASERHASWPQGLRFTAQPYPERRAGTQAPAAPQSPRVQ